jgi:hypothetical protein
MPYKDIQKRNHYQRDYSKRPYVKKRCAKSRRDRYATDEKFRQRSIQDTQAYQYKYGYHDERVRKIALQMFGSKCCLCGVDCIANGIRLLFHEIHGLKHPKRDCIKHKENYVPLCIGCHIMVTQMMKIFGLNWQQILSLKPQMIIN